MNTLRRLWTVGQFIRRGGGVKATARLAQAAPRYLALYQRLMTDPRVPASAKAVFAGAGVFIVSPLNIPGFIPVIGALDDIGILLMAESYFRKRVPAEVLAEHRAAVGLGGDMP